MLNTEKIKFWIVPKNVIDVDSWINGAETFYYIPKNGKRGRKASFENVERDAEFVRLFTKEAKTLQEIGNIYGISRERVRQRLKICGYAGAIGGNSLRCAIDKIHSPKKESINEKKCFEMFGCSREFRDKYGSYTEKNSILRGYIDQRKNARKRKIEWSLTFPEWLEIWQESGQLENRGRGKYVMSRICDMGGYSKDNVTIKTHSQNSKEARDMDEIRGRWNSVEYNGIVYRSLNSMCKELKLNQQNIRNRINRGMTLQAAILKG